jgi:hypothetical protein
MLTKLHKLLREVGIIGFAHDLGHQFYNVIFLRRYDIHVTERRNRALEFLFRIL